MATKAKNKRIKPTRGPFNVTLRELEKITGYKSVLGITGSDAVLKDDEKRANDYDALSRVQQRKEVMFDALYQLVNGFYTASSTYFKLEDTPKTVKKIRELTGEHTLDEFDVFFRQTNEHNLIPLASTEVCKVCMRGGMLLSRIRLGDSNEGFDDDTDIVDCFTYEESRTMEHYFEDNEIFDWYLKDYAKEALVLKEWEFYPFKLEKLGIVSNNAFTSDIDMQPYDKFFFYKGGRQAVRFIQVCLMVIKEEHSRFDLRDLKIPYYKDFMEKLIVLKEKKEKLKTN